MGYYPTPLAVVDLIRKQIAFTDHAVNVLDPCCGEGLALESLTRGTKAVTYGIELDGARAAEAKPRLRHVVRAAYEQTEISRESMALLYLNPPYDDNEGERKELTFLRDLLDSLIAGGLLVYIIPQSRLSSDIAELLASNFTQIRSYRFPDPEFAAFGQIVVLAKKSLWPTNDAALARELAKRGASDVAVPPLPESVPWPPYSLPPTQNAIVQVRAAKPDDLVAMAKSSALWTRVKDLVEPVRLDGVGQPPAPLHVGHLGLLLSAGCLNGLVGEGPSRHIVVGKPVKYIVESKELEVDGEGGDVEVTKRLETFRVTIKILQPSGELRKLT